MSSGYQPKLDRNALLQGYLGVDPKSAGMLQGYTKQQVDRSKIAQKPAQEAVPQRRPNPYIKSK